jgi:hypothetical protein
LATDSMWREKRPARTPANPSAMKYNQENSENGGAISPSLANPYWTSHWNVG